MSKLDYIKIGVDLSVDGTSFQRIIIQSIMRKYTNERLHSKLKTFIDNQILMGDLTRPYNTAYSRRGDDMYV